MRLKAEITGNDTHDERKSFATNGALHETVAPAGSSFDIIATPNFKPRAEDKNGA